MEMNGMHAALKRMAVYSYFFYLFVLSLLFVLSYHYLYAPIFVPHHELVNHIRSGPAEVVLDEPLPFQRRLYFYQRDFDAFLLALKSSETIRTVRCGSHLELGISENEWVLLIKTLGMIRDIHNLELYRTHGSRDFHPFQAVSDAVDSSQSLCKLYIGLRSDTFPRDPSGVTALANALQKHTALEEFGWGDYCSQPEAAQEDTPDFVFQALPACLYLRKVFIVTQCASADAMNHLLQLQSATVLFLGLENENWLVVADEIRRGRCNVKKLLLGMLQIARADATEAVIAVASAIQLDCNLEELHLYMNGFTDEAGVALAEIFTVKTALRMIVLLDTPMEGRNAHNQATLGAESYEAFSAMLRSNTSLVLKLPPFETTGADARLLDCRNQLYIEQRLNQVGRGKLLELNQTTKRSMSMPCTS